MKFAFSLLLAATLGLASAQQRDLRPPASGQLRGLWVDAFGPGLKTPEQITRLVADARSLHVNALFAQVGRRGDCYCNRASMPRTEDPEVPAGFDPLQDLIDKAHAAGIQVHAWIITTAIWNKTEPPKDPAHVFNLHGPLKSGRDNWLMVRRDGQTRAGSDFLLDPGHPDAAAYITNMYLSVVKNYDVDGVQFDRVRYPDQNEVAGVPSWGYNPVALERYRDETGETGTPAPGDPRWTLWRREQVSNLVRRTALEIKRVRPDVWIDAATITYGAGPADFAAWTKSRPYAEVLQDWALWLRAGYLDLNVMMNYKRDFVPEQAAWFAQWNAFGRRARAARFTVGGSALYLNPQESSVAQAGASLAAGLDGWAGYSYRTPDPEVNAGRRTTQEVLPELSAKLTAPDGPLHGQANWPRPDTRALRAVAGSVEVGHGPLGGRRVELVANGVTFARTRTDGSGFYGFVFTPLGSFEVRVEGAAPVRVTPRFGGVTDVPTVQVP